MSPARFFSVRNLIGVGIGAVFLAIRSTAYRVAFLAAVVGLFFALRRWGEGRAVQSGIVDFTKRVPGVGGWLSRKAVE